MLRSLLVLALAQSAGLTEPHRAWLEEEVHFLLTRSERTAFLSLNSDQAREGFIRDFWRRRDPTPGTARNEARERHLALLVKADDLFKPQGARGRFSERGRVYQLLGPPLTRNDYSHAGNRLFPLELWHYVGVSEAFLPETFYLVFYRPGGFGDYRLWSPAADGPQALVATHEPGRFLLDRGYAYQELKRIDPELATAVERLIPGEAEDLPPFSAESLLANLRDYPEVAAGSRDPQGAVTARVSFQRLEVAPLAVALADASGIPQVHYALEVSSPQVRWSMEDGRFRTSFSLSGRVLDPAGSEVDRLEDTLDVDLIPEQKKTLDEGTPLSFQGRWVLPAGRYTIDFTLTNSLSGATGVTSLPVEVREDETAVSDLILARSRSLLPGGDLLDHRPFQVKGFLLSPSPDGVFPATEGFAYLQTGTAAERLTLSWRLLDGGRRTVWQTESTVPAGTEPHALVEQRIPLQGLPEGDYRLAVGWERGTRETSLTISQNGKTPAVRVLAREGLPAGHGRIRFQRAVLLARRGDTARAIEEMSEAARLLPRDLEVHLKLAYLLSATSQHQRVIEWLEPLLPHYPTEPDLLVLLGFASLKLGRSAAAALYYERALAERPDDPKLRSALEEARKLSR